MPPELPPLPDPARLWDEAACGLLLTDGDGLLLRANRTFCRWLGVDCATLVGVRRLQDLLTVGGRIFHQTHWAPLLQLQGSLSEVKLELVGADGRPLPVVMNAVRRIVDERVLHEVALFVASDRHAYERELLAARRRAETLAAEQRAEQDARHAAAEDRALFAEQLVGIVSHDLRTPLATIAMGSEGLLLAAGTDTRIADTALRIRRATVRARRLADDLLDFTRARLGGGLDVAIASIDLHRVVGELLGDLAAAHPQRDIRHVQAGQGAVAADANRLAQLLGNLVGNALAYGDSRATVTVRSVIGADGWSLAVHNHGPAIAPALLPTLFLPMVRGDETGGVRGVGLGLYIVERIVAAHGGAIAVTSTPERGTEFVASFGRETGSSGSSASGTAILDADHTDERGSHG